METSHVLRMRCGEVCVEAPEKACFLLPDYRLHWEKLSLQLFTGETESKVNQKRNRNPDFSVPVYPIFNLHISVALFLVSLALQEYIHTPGFPCALGTERRWVRIRGHTGGCQRREIHRKLSRV